MENIFAIFVKFYMTIFTIIAPKPYIITLNSKIPIH